MSELLLWMFFYNTFTTKAVITKQDTCNGYFERYINAQALQGTASLLRSSCQENVLIHYEDGLLIARAKTSIPSGTELLCSTKLAKFFFLLN